MTKCVYKFCASWYTLLIYREKKFYCVLIALYHPIIIIFTVHIGDIPRGVPNQQMLIYNQAKQLREDCYDTSKWSMPLISNTKIIN